jgi:hypothetical protein
MHNVAVDCVLDRLQQTGEGAVHIVAENTTDGLKYQIRLSKITLCNLILRFTTCFGTILAHYQAFFVGKYYYYSLNIST